MAEAMPSRRYQFKAGDSGTAEAMSCRKRLFQAGDNGMAEAMSCRKRLFQTGDSGMDQSDVVPALWEMARQNRNTTRRGVEPWLTKSRLQR